MNNSGIKCISTVPAYPVKSTLLSLIFSSPSSSPGGPCPLLRLPTTQPPLSHPASAHSPAGPWLQKPTHLLAPAPGAIPQNWHAPPPSHKHLPLTCCSISFIKSNINRNVYGLSPSNLTFSKAEALTQLFIIHRTSLISRIK